MDWVKRGNRLWNKPEENSCPWHYGFVASRSTKYTSLLSRRLLPDDSQRAIHNQSTSSEPWACLVRAQKIFLTVQENRERSRIPPEGIDLSGCIPIAISSSSGRAETVFSQCAKITVFRGTKYKHVLREVCNVLNLAVWKMEIVLELFLENVSSRGFVSFFFLFFFSAAATVEISLNGSRSFK